MDPTSGTVDDTTKAHCSQIDPNTGAVITDDFQNTGRTGRRNAVGDILDQTSAFLSTADRPDQFQSLSFSAEGKVHFFILFF